MYRTELNAGTKRGKFDNGRPLRLMAAAVAIILAVAASGLSANPDSKGTDFWIGFPTNFSQTPTLTLFITGDTNTTGTVAIPGIAFTTPFTVTAGIVTSVAIPATAQMSAVDVVENRGIHVTSAAEVTVYGL